ncbi:MAG: Xanthine/uracil/thiamine/ascorbate permease family protein, partial [uncultured Thermomicrobiales bacterium]
AADVQYHERDRGGVRQLRADQASAGEGEAGPPGALRGGGGVPALLSAVGAVRGRFL